MRGILVAVILTGIAVPALAQAPVTTTAKICVARFRDQTPNKFDVAKLRQQLIDSLAQAKLSNAEKLIVVPIEVAESEDAQAAVQLQECQFAIYTRLLQAAAPTHDELAGGITYRSEHNPPTQFLMGIQCTVERTGSPIPALIDRQYSKLPTRPQVGIDKLLGAEVQRITEAIDKKLSSAPR